MKSIPSLSKPSLERTADLVYSLRDVEKLRVSVGGSFRLVVPKLDIAQGERIALVGASGSGKSTLLDMLAMTLMPSAATSFIVSPPRSRAVDIAALWRERRLDSLAAVRRCHFGYVLQTGGLIPSLTVRQNISLPRRLLRLAEDGTTVSLAKALGIYSQLDKRPGQLSVGERQRVAVARALSHRPAVVLADEPTASVDPLAAMVILDLLLELADEFAVTAVVASHDWEHIRARKLRRIDHELSRTEQDCVTVSRFQG